MWFYDMCVLADWIELKLESALSRSWTQATGVRGECVTTGSPVFHLPLKPEDSSKIYMLGKQMLQVTKEPLESRNAKLALALVVGGSRSIVM